MGVSGAAGCIDARQQVGVRAFVGGDELPIFDARGVVLADAN